MLEGLRGEDGIAELSSVSLYVERGRDTFHSVHVDRLDGWQSKRTELESSGSSMFRESVLMLARRRSISANLGKANWRSSPRLPTRHFSGRR